MEEVKIDPLHLRMVAGAFATGVTVVSTRDEDGAVIAMTANSFVSVSLEPALVLFSVGHQAQISNHLTQGRPVGISILNNDQREISNRFGGLPNTNPEITFIDRDACPVINKNLAWYATTVQEVIRAGDHNLILCRIHSCDRNDGTPLIYYNGYQRLE